MIRLLNPQKEDKETHIRNTKKGEKGVQCYNCEKWGHLAKNYWYMKGKGVTKGKEEGENLACRDFNDSEDMVVIYVVIDDHVDSKI